MTQGNYDPLIGSDEPAVVQDDEAEARLRRIFRLQPSGEGRMGADAKDEAGHRFELKSTTRPSVSTARDVGPHTIERWRRLYWIFARGRKIQRGDQKEFQIEEVYFLPPSSLEEWFQSLFDKNFGPSLELLDNAIRILKYGGMSDDDVERIDRLVRRGLTLNNPHIPWIYVKDHGIPITGNHATRLRELVTQHPI